MLRHGRSRAAVVHASSCRCHLAGQTQRTLTAEAAVRVRVDFKHYRALQLWKERARTSARRGCDRCRLVRSYLRVDVYQLAGSISNVNVCGCSLGRELECLVADDSIL